MHRNYEIPEELRNTYKACCKQLASKCFLIENGLDYSINTKQQSNKETIKEARRLGVS